MRNISHGELLKQFAKLSDENKAFVYEMILKLLPSEDEALTEDEIKGIIAGKQEIANGETVAFDNVNWN